MLNLLCLQGCSIYEQLQLEEALFRADEQNWCLINVGAPPAIVIGISQKITTVIHEENYLPIIRRFTGGGTVVIEPTTVLVSLILNSDILPVSPFPKDVLKWTAELYRPAFQSLPFQLKENDYTIGNRKCGGNAQGFSKKRLVHHTSFLWDYTDAHMSLLKMPPKIPEYREQRPHDDFLYRLKEHFQTEKNFVNKILAALSARFQLKPLEMETAQKTLHLPHRRSTMLEKYPRIYRTPLEII